MLSCHLPLLVFRPQPIIFFYADKFQWVETRNTIRWCEKWWQFLQSKRIRRKVNFSFIFSSRKMFTHSDVCFPFLFWGKPKHSPTQHSSNNTPLRDEMRRCVDDRGTNSKWGNVNEVKRTPLEAHKFSEPSWAVLSWAESSLAWIGRVNNSRHTRVFAWQNMIYFRRKMDDVWMAAYQGNVWERKENVGERKLL